MNSPNFIRPELNLVRTTWTLLGLILATNNIYAETCADANRPPVGQWRTLATDADLERVVRDHLQSAAVAKSSEINVSVNQGVVTLEGRVADLVQRRRAREIASSIRRVREVRNQLRVNPVKRDDRDIQHDIAAALRSDPRIESNLIEVTVTNGTAALGGFVSDWRTKQLAAWKVENVKGVRVIHNRIHLRYSEETDERISESVRRRLNSNPLLNDDTINVKVLNGRVILTGSVDTPLEREYAVADSWVSGVREVDEQELEIKNTHLGATARRRAPSDDEIRRSILDEYVYSPDVKSLGLNVEVKDGTAALSGAVPSLHAKRVAQQLAENTAGVNQVIDRITLSSGAGKADDQLATELHAALLRSPLVDHRQVSVAVNHGEVVLKGDVNTPLEKWAATDIAARTPGVSEVKNQLKTTGAASPQPTTENFHYPSRLSYLPWSYSGISSQKSDDRLASDIKEQLRWTPYVDSADLRVDVSNGTATLAGTVRSQLEKRAAEDNAFEAGAKRVKNQLHIPGQGRQVTGFE